MGIVPFPPSTSPWDQSFAPASAKGQIIFPSAVPPYADPLVPVAVRQTINITGIAVVPPVPSLWNQTLIQVPFNGANNGTTFTDEKATPLVANGAAITSTAQSVFGGSSGYFDGASNSTSVTTNGGGTKYDLGSVPFTIEGWMRSGQTGQQYTTILGHQSSAFVAGNWALMMNANGVSDGLLTFWARDFSNAAGLVTGTLAMNDSKWHHVAVVRSGDQWSIYSDGALQSSVSWNGAITAVSQELMFGNYPGFNRGLIGYLNEWRIVKGTAVYTGAAYTVPTVPFATS